MFDLKVTGDGQTLYAATFGRGIWQIPIPQPGATVPEVGTPLAIADLGLVVPAAVLVARRRRRGAGALG